MGDVTFAVRLYRPQDRSAVRAIYGDDEFARPELLARYPGMSEYLADEVTTYFLDHAPESTFVAEVEGRVVAALLGCADTRDYDRFYRHRVRPLVLGRCLLGAYGWPGWASAIVRTEWASRRIDPPAIDLELYPAHLHIGVLPSWRRCGIGVALMGRFASHLGSRGVTGYHLAASSFHPLGRAFYRELGLRLLGTFDWRLHDGFRWIPVTEEIYGVDLRTEDVSIARGV